MGEEFAFGLELSTAGPDLAQRQVTDGGPGRCLGGCQGGFGGGQALLGGGVDGCFPAAAGLSGPDSSRLDGFGQFGVRGGDLGAGLADGGEGAGLGGVGDLPGRVVLVVGVAVEGVEGEVFPGVLEVVLLPPSHCHPVGEFGGAQVGAVGQDRGLVPVVAAPERPAAA